MNVKMSMRSGLRALFLLALLSACSAVNGQAAAAASVSPAWSLSLQSVPTVLVPHSTVEQSYLALATNVGAAATDSPVSIEVHLPPTVTAVGVGGDVTDKAVEEPVCSLSPVPTCTESDSIPPGFLFEMKVAVTAAVPEGTQLTASAEIGGGNGAPEVAQTTTTVSNVLPPFGFLDGPDGFQAPSSETDGSPATLAGSHPYQLTTDLRFPVAILGEVTTVVDGGLRDASVDLPAGFLVNPAATAVRCTNAQLITAPGCPIASQIGIARILSVPGAEQQVLSAPLYNMVPPPGAASSFGFDAGGYGIFAHVLGSVRSDADFGLSGGSDDIVSIGKNPVLNVGIELWGDPASEAHDAVRGSCISQHDGVSQVCPVPAAERTGKALLVTGANCNSGPPTFVAHATSWGEPDNRHDSTYESADLAGTPVAGLDGCDQLEFEPSLEALPTTNMSDSPTGLDFRLHQPQRLDLDGRSSAPLRDATVTFPAGMVADPSQANGLAACTEGAIGFLAEKEGVHFSNEPQTCPDASKLGAVEVTSPLLAEYSEEGTRLETDPETGDPVSRPLKGSVYLAQPFQNPFGSLLAIYLAVEDEDSGIVAKLAGRIDPDPATGQLTATFTENPQLPLEDVHLDLFGGPRGALVTPPTCGTHTVVSDLVPWSAPEGADAHPESSFDLTSAPGGGSCPTVEAAAPNAPSFTAGTLSPQAGAYSPFVLKIGREDGSQRLTGIDTTLAPGLLGKLAGIAECSDAQIAQAESRRGPEEGRLEREGPSCPASSEVGTVTVGAGAGPTPFYTNGHAYLAGPYKGAPVSLVVITPAIAGPFDLGTVVIRVALHLEPETTQIHAVSDPLPTILDGIPLDIRSVALRMDRPDFTLNPTSCDPMAITGTATSSLGQAAALSSRFQVGGCSALPFRPKLALRLKGKVRRTAHPTLIANLTARPGEANVAMAQVKLPQSVFLDQGNIKTVCTRVQWSADTCPAGSVYGRAEATTPLLGYPLSGSVYLRSSSHKLPDLVVKLLGPASQPIEIDLDGKTDSVKGALRNTFEAVPDAPVSSFRLELFGGKRGLVEMSSGFCGSREAEVNLTGQNGKLHDTTPAVAAMCPKAKGKHRGHHRKRHKGHRHSRGGHRGGHGSK
jgi:hypothetical protein